MLYLQAWIEESSWVPNDGTQTCDLSTPDHCSDQISLFFVGPINIHCVDLSQFKAWSCYSRFFYISTKMECCWEHFQATLLSQ